MPASIRVAVQQSIKYSKHDSTMKKPLSMERDEIQRAVNMA
jgi:hypothetical protein